MRTVGLQALLTFFLSADLSSSYVTLKTSSRSAELITSSITYAADNGRKISLLPVIHFGTQAYYDDLISSIPDSASFVLYELLVPSSLRVPLRIGNVTHATLGGPVQTLASSSPAGAPGVVEQLTALDFYGLQNSSYPSGRSRWLLADLPSESVPPRPMISWPTLPRLSLYSPLQLLLWLFLPSPELTTILLQWVASSRPSENVPLVLPIFRILSRGTLAERIGNVRIAITANILAQSLPTGGRSTTPSSDIVIDMRNNVVMEELDSLEGDIAILYGALHAPGLSKGLLTRGFRPVASKTHTVWSFCDDDAQDLVSSDESLLPRTSAISQTGFTAVACTLLYFLIGGFDYIGNLWAIREGGWISEFSYLTRHYALYTALVKLVEIERK